MNEVQQEWNDRLRNGTGGVTDLWGSRASQEARFAALLRAVPAFRQILDVGCGYGDLLPWLAARGLHPEYQGVDVSDVAITTACSRHQGSFMHGTVHSVPGSYEVVFASGVCNLPIMQDHRQAFLEACWLRTTGTMVVNFLSAEYEPKDPTALYTDPADALCWGLALSKRVSLLHDYRDNDFTLIVRR